MAKDEALSKKAAVEKLAPLSGKDWHCWLTCGLNLGALQSQEIIC
jgi:hypothetical protein